MARGARRRFANHQARRRKAAREGVPSQEPRPEAEILSELRTLCHTPGFAHVVARAIVRDNFVFYKDEMKPEHMAHLFGFKRLIRTEIATLIGYMIQAGPKVFGEPSVDLQGLLDKVEAVLEELHHRLNLPLIGGGLEDFLSASNTAEAMREPIFYSGESAFQFQYRDFAIPKYHADNAWLEANRGFTIEQAAAVLDAFVDLMEVQVTERWKRFDSNDPATWSLLPGFIVARADVLERAGTEPGHVDAVIAAFSTRLGGNEGFVALNDYNLATTAPLICLGDDRYAVLQHYAPVKALYEAPMYWMFAEKAYRDTASANRGEFTEAMTHQRLVDVFGEENVHRGLNLDRAKGDRIGEIDILVEFAGRVLLVQAKSKRLTIAARQGNDRNLRADFKAAVQDAYDQALLCAEALLDPAIQISRADGAKVTLKRPPQAIYPICLVSDHYPSLVAQTDRFLAKRALAQVAQPIVTDIFALDALCEFLDRPIRFIGYCELRDRFSERLIYSHELVLLACHVRQNLWIDDKFDGLMLEDNITGPIEIAMLARRRGIPGERTPRGPLTAFADTPFEGMLRRIEAQAEPPLVDLALFMLKASGNSIKAYNDGVELIVTQARKDMHKHDFSLAMGGEGLTVHTSYDAPREVRKSLEMHVEARKYACRADRWFGLFLDPADGLPQFGLILEFPWEEDVLRAELAGHLSDESPRIALPASLDSLVRARPRRRLGRNDRCFCGSGLKYKKCCGR